MVNSSAAGDLRISSQLEEPIHPSRSVRRRLLVAFSLASFLQLSAGSAAAALAPRSIPMALRAPIDPSLKINQRFLSANAHGEQMVDLFIEGGVSPDALRAKGIEVNTVAGGFVTARCPLGLIDQLLATPGIRRLKVAERCKPNLDLSAVDLDLAAVRTLPPPDFIGQTGQGVLVGDVDSGIDLAHPDFKNPDGTTRLVALWDQTTAGTAPPGFTYGAYWTGAEIDAGQSTEVDTDGHGTHVLGIAGGDGSGTGNGVPAFTYVGVAPKADLIFVKTDYSTTGIIDGVNFIFQRAAALGKKAVVNLSLGTQDGPHDGTSTFDQMISALTGPGKIVVASAGNAQEENMHGQLTLSATPQNMTLIVPDYTRNPDAGNDFLLFSGWYEGSDQISVTITTPLGTVIGPVPTGSDNTDNATTAGYINILNGTTATNNGDNEIYIEIFDAIATQSPIQGTWTFEFTPVNIGSTGRVDMYLFGNGLGNGLSFVPWSQGLVAGGVIGSPGSADSVITAVAHTTKACWTSVDALTYCWNPQPPLNAIASFSSQGPLRDGRMKPDISAPGFGVASARSANAAIPTPLIVPDGMHRLEAGTSMAAPQVTGTVALLLAQPEWSNGGSTAIRGRLQQSARADGFTGTVPNVAWGAGKLHVAAAVAPLMSLQVSHPSKGQYIPPGKPDSVAVTVGGATADSVVFTLSLDGGANYTVPLGVLTSVAPGSQRSLQYFVDVSMATTQAKVRSVLYFGSIVTSTSFSDSLFLIQAPTAVESTPGAAAPRFELSSNKPNPFNPVTTIGFGTEKTGKVTLRVFSAHGRLVRTLVDQVLPAGTYRARWDGRNDAGGAIASGVYFYELASGGKRLTRKMSLLK
jgi:subtilisin family serine protease